MAKAQYHENLGTKNSVSAVLIGEASKTPGSQLTVSYLALDKRAKDHEVRGQKGQAQNAAQEETNGQVKANGWLHAVNSRSMFIFLFSRILLALSVKTQRRNERSIGTLKLEMSMRLHIDTCGASKANRAGA